MKIWIFFFSPWICFASLNFLHIPKTGGTSMMSVLHGCFPSKDFYPITDLTWDEKAVIRGNFALPNEISDILNRYPLIEQKIAVGHFPFWFLQSKDPQFDSSFTFTILREPVSRVISHYDFWVDIGRKISSPTEIDPNLMCKMLRSDCTLCGEDLLEDCKKNLESLDFILFLDDFEGGVRRLLKKLNIKYRGSVPRENKSSRRRQITDEELAQLIELNDLDIRLYEYAKTYLRSKSH